ncbi:LCM-domain-containing protein [Penicillium hispanicum]|uniref:LCM-domain-containing protein n=1 Tax=Penicillium hispanicum TaxID=1080232 RepID=UPI002542216E|nr:LCM-domain-containing protein [Penicillium hispanicum]KAJ5587316.1 LCM-domain-containing protein [Penicillium hispanicum]
MAPAQRPARAMASKAEREADMVMGTNSSSIMSKRSVERIYYPEPHFFRYFVKKPQRRSPLNNRVYWLRMHTMEETVRQFMEKAPADKPKYVLNLGCGYDPLPFILLSREKKSMRSGNTVFVDVDYEKLMAHKKNAIRQTEVITEVLGDIDSGEDQDAIQIRSPRYIAVGCDLKNLEKLDDVLRNSVLPSAGCSVLCIAEVSLTYMDIKSANEILIWASTLTSDVQFCMLEQLSPDGLKHPFANTMMTNYNKIGTPLHAIHEFPTLAQQEQRFKRAGWAEARARSLWDLWSDTDFVPSSLRKGLDSYEVFDEWEEFALSASHFFLLIASNNSVYGGTIGDINRTNEQDAANVSAKFLLQAHCPPDKRARRRYGAIIPDGAGSMGHYGGQGEQSRLATTDLYARADDVVEPRTSFPPRDIPARMCHTISPLDGDKGDCLLVGGRTSPAAPLEDCWLRRNNAWSQVHPLPEPRSRHSAVNVLLDNSSRSILVYGGKTKDNAILASWLLWDENDEQEWQSIESTGPVPEARFGASIGKFNEKDSSGVLFGGIGSDGTVLEDFWIWSLSRHHNGKLHVELSDITEHIRDASPQLYPYCSRFGATVNTTSHGLIIAGGISRQLIPAEKEILLIDSMALVESTKTTKPSSTTLISAIGLGHAFAGPRPLLTGHVACTVDTDQVLLFGGGAVCFPSGTFWTEGAWLLKPKDSTTDNTWEVVTRKREDSSPHVTRPTATKLDGAAREKSKEPAPIPRTRIESATQFQQIVDRGKPVVIEGSDIGPCTQLWTKDYLTSAVGEDRKVVVHAAQSEQMNFQSKNFSYVTKSFGSFLDEVHAGGRQYLRSISAEQPSKLPASLAVDFPTLQDDFKLPDYMALVADNAHSSPLRISGPVTMWLHYDVMANVLCQIRGERRLVLFPPDDVQALHIPAGASSSTIDIFERVGLDATASIPGTSPHEAILRPGEILFIPPLWLHTACSATSDVSVAVNVFFRNLTKGYAAGRDVYGNRDLQAYEASREGLQRLARSFDGVPPNMARFYLRRLAQELQEIADQ